MADIIGFDSFDAMMAHVQRADEAAQARITDAHRTLLDATETLYVYRHVAGLDIWGEVPSLDETIKIERAYYPDPFTDDGEDAAEFGSSAARMIDSRQRGYLFGRWYSIVEPHGELGSAHVIVVTRISRSLFDAARLLNWGPPTVEMMRHLAADDLDR
jgi:hypothetical protein